MRKYLVIIILLNGFISISQNSDSTLSSVNNTYNKFRFGAYGEILYQHMNYSPDRYNHPKGALKDNRAIIDIPRLVLEFNYKFRKDLEFVSEIEFEHGGTGAALELEYEEMGEYEMEMEKAGEVVIEQFWIKKSFSRAFNLKIGHMIVPVGITNARHLPTNFFTTIRPEGEYSILPLTWHETGIAILGNYRRWSYELQLINGLDANGFSSANWIKHGKQGIFETIKFTNPALVLRVENRNINNLKVGASLYYGKSAANTAKPEKMKHIDGAVSIANFDFEYDDKRLVFRGNLVYGNLGDSEEISSINKNTSKNIQYPRTPVASKALTYSFEIGYDILSFFNKEERLFPFIRYEYYNSMEQTDGLIFQDARYNRQIITAGINFFLLNDLALKIDYSMRIIDGGNYNKENTIGIALVFNTWFLKN